MARRSSPATDTPKASPPTPAREPLPSAPAALDGPAYQGDEAADLESSVDALMARLEAPREDKPDTPEAESQRQDDGPTDGEPADKQVDQPEDTPDDLELSADDLEHVDESTSEEPRPAEPPRIKVTLPDGVETELTPDELAKGYLRRSDYDRKRAEEARAHREREAEIAAEKEAVAAERKRLAVTLDELERYRQHGGLPPPPDESLLEDDPGEYLRQKHRYDKARDALQAADDQRASERKKQEEAERARHEEYLAEQRARLPELIPAWTDGQGRLDLARYQREAPEIHKWATSQGADPQVVAGLTDAFALAALRKAWLYDRAMERKRSGNGAAAGAPKPQPRRQVVIPSQASSSGSDEIPKAVRRAEDNFARDLDANAAADLLFAKAEAKRSRA